MTIILPDQFLKYGANGVLGFYSFDESNSSYTLLSVQPKAIFDASNYFVLDQYAYATASKLTQGGGDDIYFIAEAPTSGKYQFIDSQGTNQFIVDSQVTITSVILESNGALAGDNVVVTFSGGGRIEVQSPETYTFAIENLEGAEVFLSAAAFVAQYADGYTPSEAPVFDAIPTDINIEENADGSTAPVAVTTISATRANTYALTSVTLNDGTDVSASFAISSAGVITYIGTGLDSEAGHTSVSITITVTGSGGTLSQAITVAVTDLNDDAPVFADGDDVAASVVEGVAANTLVHTFAEATPDLAGGDVIYALDTTTGDHAAFTFDATTRELRIVGSPAERTNPYVVTISATVAGLSTTQTLTLTVTDDDADAPVFSSAATAAVTEGAAASFYTAVAEADLAASGVTYGLSGGGEYAEIDVSTGEVTLKTSFDFEALSGNSFDITITATDNTDSARVTSQTVTVTVADANDETPVVTVTAVEIDETTAVASPFEVTAAHIGVADADRTAVADTEVVITITTLAVGGTLNNDGTTLGVGDSFTLADLNNGLIELDITDSGAYENFKFTVSDGVNTSGESAFALSITFDFAVTTPDEGNTIDLSSRSTTGTYIVDAGDGSDTIIGSAGDDVIDGGQGIDVITLSDADDVALDDTRGADTIIYEFGSTSGSFVGHDGTNIIKGFTRGEDTLRFVTQDNSGNYQTIEQFFGELGTGFRAQVAYHLEKDTPEGPYNVVVTGLVFEFRQYGSFSNGLIAGAHLEIEFDETMTAVEFLEAIGGVGNYDSSSKTIINWAGIELYLGGAGSIEYVASSMTIAGSITDTDEGVVAAGGLDVAEITVTNGDDLTLSIDNANFELSGTTLRLKEGVTLDFNDQSGGVVIVTATKPGSVGLTQTFTIAINDDPAIGDNPAVFADDVLAFTVAENNYNTIFTATATDRDADDTVTYRLKAGVEGNAKFEIDTSTGAVNFAAGEANFEGDGPVYTVVVEVVSTDSASLGKLLERSYEITLTDEAESPTGQDNGVSYVRGTAYTFAATDFSTGFADVDGDAFDGITIATLPSEGVLELSGAAVTENQVIDAADIGSLTYTTASGISADAGSATFTYYVSDGALSSVDSYTLTVTIPEAVATAIVLGQNAGTIDEGDDVAASTLTTVALDVAEAGYDFTVDDGRFEVVGGELRIVQDADFDADSEATVVVTITATKDSDSFTNTYTVTVTDLNDEAPVFSSGATGSALVENTEVAITTAVYTADAAGDAGAAVVYSLTAGADVFSIDANTGIVTFIAPTTPDFEASESYTFTVTATAGDQSAEQVVTIAVTDLNDVAPVFSSGATGDALVENTEVAIDTAVYTAIAAGDAGAAVVYSLSSGADVFSIDANTGIVTFIAATTPDFETSESYTFTVTATAGDQSAEQVVTIAVTDLNDEAPVFSSGATGSALDENTEVAIDTAVYTADASGDAGAAVVYSLTAGADVFSIDANTGIVTFIAPTTPDFEADASYTFTVTATAGDQSAEQVVTIAVTDIDDGASGTSSVRVLDGPVSGAAVYFDIDGDGVVSQEDRDHADNVDDFGNPRYVTGADGIADVPTRFATTFFVADVNGAIDTQTGEELEGEFHSFGDGQIATPIADLIYEKHQENLGVNPQATMEDAATEVLTALFETTVTLDDVKNPDNYVLQDIAAKPAVIADDGSNAQEVQDRNAEIEEFDTQTAISKAAVVITEIKEAEVGGTLVSGLGLADATLDTVIAAVANAIDTNTENDNAALDTEVNARIAADMAIREGRPVALPDGNVQIDQGDVLTVGEHAGGAEALFGFTDPNGNPDTNSDSSDDIASAFGGIYIDTSAANGVSVAIGGVVITADVLSSGDALPAEDASVRPAGYFFISASRLAELQISSTDAAGFSGELDISYAVFDGEEVSQKSTLTIIVNEEITAPSFTSGATGDALVENTEVAIDTTVYTADADGHGGAAVVYSLSSGSDVFSIDAASGAVTFTAATTPDAETDASYTFTVTATARGQSTDQVVTIAVTDVDEAPTFETGVAGAALVDAETVVDTVVVYTLAATSPAGQTVAYSLAGTDEALFEIDNNGAVTFIAAERLDLSGNADGYSFTVVASAGGESSEQTVTLTIAAAVAEPVATTITLATSASTIDEGDDVTTSVLTAVTLAGDDVADYTVYSTSDDARFNFDGTSLSIVEGADFDFETDGAEITVTVTAETDGGASVDATYILTLTNVVEAPTFEAGTAGDDLVDAEVVADTVVVYTAAATSPVGQTVDYSLEGTDATLFEIDSSGVVTFIAAETLDLSGNADGYSFTVVASAGGESSEQTVTLTIDAAAVPTTITLATSASTIAEGDGVAASDLTAVTLTGDDVADYTVYSTSDYARFNFDGASLSIVEGADFNFEDGETITVTVTAAVDGGGASVSADYTLTLTDVSEAPAFAAGVVGVDLVDAETVADTAVVYTAAATSPVGQTVDYSLEGTDATLFEIDSSGVVTFIAAETLDLSGNADGYSFTVVASAGGERSEQAVTLTIVAAVEPVATTIALGASASTIDEGDAVAASDLTAVTLTGDDTAGYTFTTDDNRFEVVGGMLRIVAGSNFDFETAATIAVIITASKDTAEDLTITYTLTLNDVAEAPEFGEAIDGDGVALFDSETVADNTVVYTLAATAPVSGQTVTYSLDGTDASLFDINAATGVVTFKTATTPNFETDQDGYTIEVTAEAGGETTAAQSVTISITPVDEFIPTVGGTIAGAVDAGGTTVASGSLTLTPDGDHPTSPSNHLTTTIAEAGTTVQGKYGSIVFTDNDWEYTLDTNDDDTQSIANDEVVTDETFTVTSQGADRANTGTITISITGSNTAPTIDVATSTGAVNENADGEMVSLISFTAVDVNPNDQDYQASEFTIFSETEGVGDGAVRALFEVYLVSGSAATSVFGIKLKAGQTLDREATDTHRISLIYNDGDTDSANSGILTIHVTDVVEAPVFTSSATGSVTDGTLAGVVYTATSTTAPGQIAAYELASGGNANLFTIDSVSGEVTFVTPTTPDADAGSNPTSYTFTILARAGGESTPHPVTINVIAVDEHQPIVGTEGDDHYYDLDDDGNVIDNAIYGDNGDNVINGLGGEDIIIGGRGADTIDGGDGDYDGSSYEDSGAAITIDLSVKDVDGYSTGSGGEAEGDRLKNIEHIIGSDYDDTITGDEKDNIIRGGRGADTIDGGGGSRDAVSYRLSDTGITIDLSIKDAEGYTTGSGGHATGDRIKNIERLRGSDHDDTLTGDDNNNLFYGRGGADRIDGGAGFDDAAYWLSTAGVTIDLSMKDSEGYTTGSGGTAQGDRLKSIERVRGSDHVDTFTGDENNNLFEGRGGADIIDGGDGFDSAAYWDSTAGVTIDLSGTQDSNGFVTGLGGDAEGDKLRNIENIRGSDYDDTLTGDENNNRFVGRGGADTLDGGAGVDIAVYWESNVGVTIDLSGTQDSNGFVTGSGGEAEDDKLRNIENLGGSDYDDTLTGDDDVNRIWGDLGDDTINGGGGHDTIFGGRGADTLDGGEGVDIASYYSSNAGITIDLSTTVNGYSMGSGGEAQGDRIRNVENIYGSEHADTMIGDAADNLFWGRGGADTLDGGEGVDIAVYWESNVAVTIDLSGTQDSNDFVTGSGGEAEDDKLKNIENLGGSDYDDTLTGDDDVNRIWGNLGDDTINGGGGHDTIFGGRGADTLDGGEGVDIASYYSSNAGITIDLSTTVNGYSMGSGGEAQGDRIRNVENIYGSEHADTMIGDAADNLFWGRGGADTLDGGEGVDIAVYWESNVGVTIDLSGTQDSNDFVTGSGGDAEGDKLKNIENLGGSDYDDTLTGDDNANWIWGNLGDDTIDGGGDDDTIFGGRGADILDGGAGEDWAVYWDSTAGITIDLSTTVNGYSMGSGGEAQGDRIRNIESVYGSDFDDTLTGDDQDNVLAGGGGADRLEGGAGFDTFVLNTGQTGADTVIDFTQSEDKIRITTATGAETTLAALQTSAGITISGNTISVNGNAVMDLDGFSGTLAFDDFAVVMDVV